MAKRRSYLLLICLISIFLPLSWLVAKELAPHLYSNFTTGELTRKLDTRVDFEKYFDGARELTNLIIYPHGGAYKRPGTYYVAEPSGATAAVRLISMQITDTLGYIVEMGHEYMRFFYDQGLVGSADEYTTLLLHFNDGHESQSVVDSGTTDHTSGVSCRDRTSTKSFTPWNNRPVFGSGFLHTDRNNADGGGLYLRDHNDWFQGTQEFTIDFWFSAYGAISPTNDLVPLFQQYDTTNDDWVSCFWYENQLYFEIQDNGVTTITLRGDLTLEDNQWYHVAIIRGYNGNADDWALMLDGEELHVLESYAITWEDMSDPLFITDTDTDPVGGDYGAIAGSFHVFIDEFRLSKNIARWTGTFSPHDRQYPNELTGGGFDGGTPLIITTPFQSEDLFDIHYAQSIDVIYFAHPDYDVQKLTRSGHASWALAEISGAAEFTSDPFRQANAYPSTVTFHEERLVFANTNDEPNSIWMSKAGNYTDFTTGANDDDATGVTLAASELNEIQWIRSGPVLAIGTIGGEWTLGPMSSSAPLSPTNIQAKKHTTHGSSNVTPVQIGRQMIFAHRSGAHVRNFRYDFDVDGYRSSNLSILAEHLFDGADIKQIAWQEEPASTLWIVLTNGKLIGLTYNFEQKIFAWHEQETEGDFESVTSITNADGNDELWFVVERTLPVYAPKDEWVTNKFIEYMKQPETAVTTNFFYVDCGLSYDGGATTTISGLSHLSGSSVAVLADGLYIGEVEIDNLVNEITLTTPASVVHVGLPYTATLETLDLPPGLGRTNLIKQLVPYFYKTWQAEYGWHDVDGYHWTEIDFEDAIQDQGLSGTSGFTGNIKLNFGQGWRMNQTIFFKSDEPVPFCLSGLQIFYE